MTTPTPDLAWDHSAGENLITEIGSDLSDDFDDVTFYNGTLLNESALDDQEYIKITKRHLSFLLRSLEEVTSLLREQGNLHEAASSRLRSQQRSVTADRQDKCKRCCSRMFKLITKYNLVVTLILQAIMLGVVTILDSSRTDSHSKTPHNDSGTAGVGAGGWPTCFVMILITTINLCFICYISVTLTKTMIQSRATTWMLAQAYLSTVVMFAGLYTITYTLYKKGWTLHVFNAAKDSEVIAVSYLYVKMLYHSISTSSLCGSSTIHPDVWYNFLIMAAQMLLSFLYFTSILRVVTGSASSKAGSSKRRSRPIRRNQSQASLASRGSTEQTRLFNGHTNHVTTYGGL